VTTLNTSLASRPAGDSAWSRPDNRFVPLRACDLAAVLAADASRFGANVQQVRDFASALEQVIDRETGTFERRLTDAYARFNPDRDTRPLDGASPPSQEDYEVLNSQLGFLLDKANYEELDDVQIAQAVMRARTRNLSVRVDPSRVELLRIWVRGRGTTTKCERCRWRPWRTESFDVPVFKRLVVVARLKGDPHVILKLFKDIPEADAEALLPHAEVMMSLWDRIKLLGTGAGTLGITVSKILKIAIGFAALWKLAWILLIGLATLGIRSALGYRNARINRNWQRTQHLYFQNMGNNASALQLLVAKVKQEEFKEVLLAYFFSQPNCESGALPLCERIERYLRERFGVEVDFDIADAESKLHRLRLIAENRCDSVLPVEEAIAVLRCSSLPHSPPAGVTGDG
jgi:hypothetical protein